ncbi:MAG: TonB-dependent receptor plug domain-containing protein, partial [Aliifodinibius sp.]|nr:TonB-dependent receptor [Fodinibius sp.]NIW44315.1 TonB-dependent receptor plug domain-containing protein [Gammaproteobacteria bacterium]NIX02314.1 TonB-dependent receptor plug domain-containing protein [Phycisphaerae bacterium]NIY24772.1 TonB-dependent receptor plug domain-containing protein [Fodinibius sp.]
QVTGTITNAVGRFELTGLNTGRYAVEFYFIGYETKRIKNIELNPRQLIVDMGEIALRPDEITVDDVEVEGERALFSYQIDKKVIKVDQQHTVVSGTAVDVLENVPSVTVDIEGNVSLRGSGSFRVLIDGRPTILDASEALQQIPASTIKNIEIITNPSARHDPEGTAGIINIIMKKNKRNGRSGMANVNAGMNDKYGADVLIEFKNDIYNATLGVDYNYRIYTGEDLEE